MPKEKLEYENKRLRDALMHYANKRFWSSRGFSLIRLRKSLYNEDLAVKTLRGLAEDRYLEWDSDPEEKTEREART